MRTNNTFTGLRSAIFLGCLASGAASLACGPRASNGSDTGGDTTSASDGSDSSGEEADGGGDANDTADSADTMDSGEETSSDEGVTEDFFVDVDGEPCDYWEQDCPSGFKCTTASIDGTLDQNVCRPVVPNPKQQGEDCDAMDGAFDGYDDCAKGLYCFNVDEQNQGTCLPQCMGSPNDPTCPDGFECSISGSSAFAVCLQSCDPLGDDCGDDQVCIPDDELFSCAVDQGDGDNPHGTPCMFANQCDNGNACIDASFLPNCEEGGCCAQFCDLMANDTCPDMDMGVMCTPYYEEGQAPPQFEDLGICVAL